MSIVCVGSVALDSLKTPSGERTEILGGAASYFSMAASQFTHVDVVAVVGEDFPKEHIATLSKRGVGLAGLEHKPGRTFRWKGEYGFDLNEAKTLATELNVFESFSPKVPEDLRKSEWVFLGNIDPKLQLDVLNQIAKPKLVAMDTMNYWITGQLEALKKVLERIDLLFVNDGEARQLAGESNIVRAAAKIRQMGPKIVCIKRGEYGAMVFQAGARDSEDIFAIPAMPLTDVQDPTGAGDSFAGGFMGSLAAHGSVGTAALRQSAVYGTVLASFAVERFGLDRLVSLTKLEVEARFEAFGKLTWHGSAAGGLSPGTREEHA
jgi:sugar/nucleoside kinase (ribokinase family)